MPEIRQLAQKAKLFRAVFDNLDETFAPQNYPTKAQKEDCIQSIQNSRRLARIFQCRYKGLK